MADYSVLWYIKNPSYFPWHLIGVDRPSYGPAHICVIKILKAMGEHSAAMSVISPTSAIFELKSKEYEPDTAMLVDAIMRCDQMAKEQNHKSREALVLRFMEMEFWGSFSDFVGESIKQAISAGKYSHPKAFSRAGLI